MRGECRARDGKRVTGCVVARDGHVFRHRRRRCTGGSRPEAERSAIQREREDGRDIEVDVHRGSGPGRRRPRADVCSRGGIPRVGSRGSEVRCVIASVAAAFARAARSQDVGRSRCRAGALEIAGAAIADEVFDGWVCGTGTGRRAARERSGAADERDLPTRRCEIARSRRIGSRQRRADRRTRCKLDQVVAPGRHCSRERRCLPRRSGRGRVLHRPPRDVDGACAGIEELYEVVLEGRAAVTAAAVDLAHDDARRARTGRARQEE